MNNEFQTDGSEATNRMRKIVLKIKFINAAMNVLEPYLLQAKAGNLQQLVESHTGK